jgi:hypothetical protein
VLAGLRRRHLEGEIGLVAVEEQRRRQDGEVLAAVAGAHAVPRDVLGHLPRRGHVGVHAGLVDRGVEEIHEPAHVLAALPVIVRDAAGEAVHPPRVTRLLLVAVETQAARREGEALRRGRHRGAHRAGSERGDSGQPQERAARSAPQQWATRL